MNNINKKYIFNILLISIIGGGSIYFSMGKEFSTSIDALYNANPFWLLIAFIFMLLYYLVDGSILYLFGRKYNNDYKLTQGIKNALCGQFWCGITPFSSGGQFAQMYIFTNQGINAVNSASILLMCFIVYQTVLVLLTAFILIFKINEFSLIYNGLIFLAFVGFLINAIVIICLFLSAKSKNFQQFICDKVVYFGFKLKLIKDFDTKRASLLKTMGDFRNELVVLQSNVSLLIKALLLNLLKLLIIYSIPYYVAKSLYINVDNNQIFQFISLCSVIYLITSFVPIPGASGGSEGVYLILFSHIFGIYTATSLLLWRFITYYMGLILGGIVFSLNTKSKKERI